MISFAPTSGTFGSTNAEAGTTSMCASGNGRSVTFDGIKSMSVKMFGLYGWMPVARNPLVMFDWVSANARAGVQISGKSVTLIGFPGFDRKRAAQPRFRAFFKGPKTERSSGWSLCVQCGGNDSTVMPFSLQKSRPLAFRCDS